MTWTVRRASVRDRDALVTLCRESVGPDDYVIDYLDDLLRQGVVQVAIAGGERVVGMMSGQPCIDGSMWLGQARTHPEVRRQGVARAIIESFARQARASGDSALRLWTEAGNEEGIRSFTAAGFREVARFTRVIGDPAQGTPRGKPRAFDEDLWRQVSGSSIAAKGRGYANHKWYFVAVTRGVTDALAAKGVYRAWDENVLAVGGNAELQDTFWFTMWAGEAAELFAEARRLAGGSGAQHAGAFIPHDPDLLAEAHRNGFEPGSWGREAILAERPVVL